MNESYFVYNMFILMFKFLLRYDKLNYLFLSFVLAVKFLGLNELIH